MSQNCEPDLTFSAFQAQQGRPQCDPVVPKCAGGRAPVKFRATVPASATAFVLTICPKSMIEVSGLYFTVVDADLSATDWQWNQLPMYQPESNSLAGHVTETPALTDFTLAVIDADVNLMPGNVTHIGGTVAIQITIANAAASDAIIEGWVLGVKPK
jgi:hypothetical protein